MLPAIFRTLAAQKTDAEDKRLTHDERHHRGRHVPQNRVYRNGTAVSDRGV